MIGELCSAGYSISDEGSWAMPAARPKVSTHSWAIRA